MSGNTRNSEGSKDGTFAKGEQSGLENATRSIHQEVIKFNAFDLAVGRASLGSIYLRNEVKLWGDLAFTPKGEGDVSSLDSGVYLNNNNNSDPDVESNRIGRWVFNNIYKDYVASDVPDAQLLREVSTYSYLPANTINASAVGGLGADIRCSEAALYLKVRGGHPSISTAPGFAIDTTNIPAEDVGIPALDITIEYKMTGYDSAGTTDYAEHTYLTTLCQRKDDVYLPFTE